MDDLTAPLGLAPAKQPKSRLKRLRLGAAALASAAVVMVGWALLIHDPRGGEPVAIAPVAEPVTGKTGSIRQTAAPAAPASAVDSGSSLVEITPAGGLTELANGVVIHDPNAPEPVLLTAAPDEALIEEGPYGPLPRIGPDGARPMEAYARPVDGDAVSGKARIAIVVGGVGIAVNGTSAAIGLPADVTLAFAPYGKNLARSLAEARRAGHEILLQVPLEPFGYPRNDPGPHTLTVAATDEENRNRLAWLMSRITTYVGVVNFLGARFTGTPERLQPVLDEIGKRGLLYLDDGSSGASRADTLSSGVVPFGRADLVIDADADAAPIDARLKQLEAIAKERGYAIGSATAFPLTIERIAAFARDAADRGIVLVPVTALVQSGRT